MVPVVGTGLPTEPYPDQDGLIWQPLGDVTEPGAYVCRESGDLVRIAPTGAASDSSELIERQEAEPVYVVRIHPDPFVAISRARVLAANLDVEISF